MTPEQEARTQIDKLLQLSGWVVQDYAALNLGVGLGVAVREFPVKGGTADYLLFMERVAVGVVEAKKVYSRAALFQTKGWVEAEGEDGPRTWNGYIQMLGETSTIGTGEFRYPKHLSWDGNHHLERVDNSALMMKVIQYEPNRGSLQVRFVKWRKDHVREPAT